MFHFFKKLADTVANAKPNKLRLFADENELFKVKNSQGVVRTLGNAVRSFEYVSTNGLVDIYLVKTDDFEFDLPVTNGRGIESIDPPAGAGEPGALDEYIIVFNDGTQDMLLVRNGTNGKDGTGVPTLVVAQTIGDENTAGTPGPEYANIDHKHAHGEQTNPAHHAVATISANGFMSKEDKEKLLGVAAGATRVLVDASPADGSNNAVASNGVFDALALKLNADEKGAANGLTPLGPDLKVAAIYLPSYVDDVLEFANLAAFPATGEQGKIYVALNAGTPADPSRIYRWSGSTYIEMSPSPGSTDAVPEGSSNQYFTAARVRDTVLSGLSLATNAAITAADSVLSAFGKLQKQLSEHFVAVNPHPQYLTSEEANLAYTPVSHVGVGGAQHAVAIPNTAGGAGGTGGSAGFLSAALRTNIGNLFGNGAFYNIKDFGAVADDVIGAGGTDNTAAIQAAIDTAQAAGGGIVFVPAGNYSIMSGLTVRSSGVTIMGAGCGYTADVGDYRTGLVSCISWRGAAGAVMLDVFPQSGATVFPVFGFQLHGLSLDGRDLQAGPTDTGATPPAVGIRMRACSGAHLSNFFLNGPFTTAALDLTTLPPGTIGGVDSHGILRCIFERFCIRQLDGTVTPGIGMRLSGSASANVNFCKFDTFQIMYRNNSTRQPAIQLGNSDSNTFIMGACNSNGATNTNWGIEILGSNVSAAEVSRANIFYHCSAGTGGAFLAGTALGRTPNNTADATLNFTNPATDNQFRPISTENGEPVPVFGTGATGGYGITGGSTGPRFWGEGSTLASRATSLLVNSTTLTQVIGFTAPANFLRAGTVLEFAMTGFLSNAGAASTHTVAVRIGGVVVASALVALGATARTNQPAEVSAKVLVSAAGAAGSALGPVVYKATGGALIATTTPQTAPGAVNTTIANLVELVITSSIATSTYNVQSAEIRLANQ